MGNIQIKTLEIAGFRSVLEALRLPYGKECRSETSFLFDRIENKVKGNYSVDIDEKDLLLLSTLVKRGDEHCKCVRVLIVYAEITMPRFMWVEMDTYRVGTERLSSESTMHIQGKGLSTEELVKMKSELKEGTMQKRVQMFSYQTLRRIYSQRRNHRLPMWHDFCSWIESLPYAKEFITLEHGETR